MDELTKIKEHPSEKKCRLGGRGPWGKVFGVPPGPKGRIVRRQKQNGGGVTIGRRGKGGQNHDTKRGRLLKGEEMSFQGGKGIHRTDHRNFFAIWGEK